MPSVEIHAALELITRMVQPACAHLTIAVANLAGGRARHAREAVERWRESSINRTADRLDEFIAACTDARSADELDAGDALEAHLTAVSLAVDASVRSFAQACRLFNGPVSLDGILLRTLKIAREHGREDEAIQSLRDLRDREPEALEVRDAIATLCLDQGRVSEGVRELRFVAERRDAAGDVDGMVKAMRRISDALPANAEVKTKIVEGFLQRGVLDEAMLELESLGELQCQRGKASAAVAAFTRGADVAAAIGNFKRATEFLDHAVMADPESDAVRHEAVAFFLRIGSVDRAVEHLWELVRIAMQAQDPDEAVAALHQIIALTPNDPSAYHKLGEVLASLGEYMQAEKVYRRLSTITPDDPVLNAKQAALAALASPR
jgi:tetratricopeptide (TPR) repeat protein